MLLLAGGIAGWLQWRARASNPDTIFRAALDNSLSTVNVEAVTTGPANESDRSFDFSNLKDPLVSSKAGITRYGASYQVAGYASAKNSYLSYVQFPATAPAAIADAAQNGWIHLRNNGVMPNNVGYNLAYVADPRYTAFGVWLFGNFPADTRPRLAQYAVNRHVYAYDTANVTRDKVGSTAVYVYPVKLNVPDLKFMNQSAALLEGFGTADVQAAIDNLDSYKHATLKLYISISDHRLLRLESTVDDETTTVNYSNYGHSTVSNEPETKLAWVDFAAPQLQLDQAAAKQQAAAQLDAERQGSLAAIQPLLERYNQQNTFYPTYNQLNDAGWIASNLAGLNPDWLRDPLGNNWQLLAQPRAGNYAYQVATPTGKSCDNNTAAAVSQLCTHYSLTALLSTGKQYSVTNQ